MKHSRLFVLTLFLSLLMVLAAVAQKTKPQKTTKKPTAQKVEKIGSGNEEKVRDLVAFFQLLLNTLGSNNTSARDKEVVITESYAKVFRDDKVQIEDDLAETRSVITNKDVVAYLKDVDFFFKDVRFEFDIDDIEEGVNANGQVFYKVSGQRHLKGTTAAGNEIENTVPRFIEVNYDPDRAELKIVSVYTNEFDEREALTTWWAQLSLEWREIFRKRLEITDSVELNDIKDMMALNELDLSENDLIQNIEPLGRLTNLKMLNLAGTGVPDLTPIRNLTELVELNLERSAVFDLSPLRYASKLERLNISRTEIRSIEVLERMPALKNLEMERSHVFDFEPLTFLPELRNLDLKETQIASLSPLENLGQLMELNISKTAVQDLAPLRALSSLVTLNADSSLIRSVEPLSGLANLQVLQANYTFIADLSPLLALPELKRVYCDQTPVKKPVADKFMSARPDVLIIYDSRDLQAWWNSIPEEWHKVLSEAAGISMRPGKEELARVTNVDSVDLGGNASVTTLEPLRKLLKLEVIIASNTSVSDLSPLQDHRDVRYLDISDTQVADISPVARFGRLTVLRADRSNVESVEPLFHLKELKRVYVDRTAIHDILAREFLEKNPDCLIVYKTIHLDRWWKNLSPGWRRAFFPQSASDTTVRREDLHRLVEQETLVLKDVHEGDLQVLEQFVRLRDLHFSATAIAEIPPLENLRSLRSLRATSSPLRSIGFISQLTELRELDISDTPIDDLKGLEGLQNLTSVNCAGTQVRKLDPLKPLYQLEYLDCSNTGVSKLDPVMYLSLRNLKCYNTRVSDREIRQFRENNPECQVVYYR